MKTNLFLKNKIYLFAIFLIALIVSSCSYLDVELQNQMTMEEVFTKRSTTENYLAQVYGYLPYEYDPLWNEGVVVTASDEALFSWLYGEWNAVRTGSWGVTSDPIYHNWTYNYKGIQQATIFMENVDKCIEIDEKTRQVMKAEARFIRAYLYFTMFRKYGPVYVWGDKMPDQTIKPEVVDRHSVEENINFMISEYDKVIEALPLKITDAAWNGRLTKGVAMAAKSRLLLYAARPLFNGCELYKGLKNHYDEYLFPQSPDANKWELAAKAAKAVIDLDIYSLYEDKKEDEDPFRHAIKSYMGIYFDKWNSEIIWGRWIQDGGFYASRSSPPQIVKYGGGGFCPSLKLVDTYPMAETGRYPVIGYTDTGYPIIDTKSNYVEEGFTNNYTHPLDTFSVIKIHNSCVGRDARFYASVLASGMYWINTYKGKKLVTFYKGGTSSYNPSTDCVKSGYVWRRFCDPSNNTDDDNWGQYCWPYYRLAEVYLNYAEACNEKPERDEAEALKYLNKVRHRSGLNDMEAAYPEVKGNQSLLRELIRKERMVELAFEGHRYYDVRTWMIAPDESNKPNYTRNVAATNYEESWQRTDQVFPGKLVFEPKHYFFPIHQNQLNEMKNITQNHGW